ncbi:MAG: DUF4012 domain-containing protein [Actinomycetales bacterium]|nr:DUF4012 domain-containing protein [Actinomycetales bacterium]
MRTPSHATGPEHALMRKRRRLVTRWWFWTAVGVLAIVVAGGSWVGVRGLQAKAELESAQTLVSQLKAQALDQNIPGAATTLETLRAHSAKAQELTNDQIWRAAEIVPVLGRNLTVVRELAAVTNTVVTDAIDPLLQVASMITPASLAPKDGAIDLAPFQQAVAPVTAANTAIRSAVAMVDAIDTSGTLSQLPAAKKKLGGLLTDVAPMMQTLQTVLPMLPAAMGAEVPRNYVLMFQNDAEARALGGTALSFALVTMDNGKIELTKTVPAGFGNFDHYATSVIPAPDGVEGIYADTFGMFIANATVRPSFVSAAQITSVMWEQQFGLVPDGVISIDPVVLGYILRATGPIPLSSGDVLTDKTIVPLLLNEVYQRYNSGNNRADNVAQDAVYGEAVAATFDHLSTGKFDAKILLGSIVQGWDERRLLVWSAHEDEQAQFAKAGLNGELPQSDTTTDRVGVYFQDAVGSKMSYYLTQSVQLSQAACRTDGRDNYRISVDLTNTAPANALQALSLSILGQSERAGLEPGDQRMIVMLYAPPGSQIVGATAGGAAIQLEALHDTDYPVGKVRVEFAPGAT